MADHEIKIEGFAFIPAELEIQPGDTVIWTNLDPGMPHTATSTNDAAESFDTGDLAQNESGSHKFENVSSGDELPYVCTHHGFMTGMLTVA